MKRHPRYSSLLPFTLLAALAGCSGSAAGPIDPAPGSAPSTPAGSGSTAVTGGGAISGTADGTPFTTISTALWIGAPDDDTTLVVYVFSKPVACSALASSGWDARLSDDTQYLELKMYGSSPATYSVVSKADPGSGEAAVSYALSSSESANDTIASTGTVTLDLVTPDVAAKGSFVATFGAGEVKGSFDAASCPGGHEP